MRIVKNISELREIIKKIKRKRKIVGFVPTMGALHLGHLSLIRKAKKEADFVVVSIFVNPTQFGPNEDYKRYPRPFKKDKEILEKEKVDLLFYPSVKTMYSKDFSTYVEEVSLSKVLCGKFRPGHFKGVCTVVAKLFNIVAPNIAYFGQKDYQQARIIKRMVRDLNFPVKIKVLPIVREKDGLALSSRNSYLSLQERKDALCLYKALNKAKELIEKGEREVKLIKREMKKIIKKVKYTKIDYIEIVDADNLREIERIKGKILIALAVWIGKARLIDNFILNVK
jgi:pantoate--beta-alanine ligase